MGENKVAQVIKIYAVLNGVAGAVIGLVVMGLMGTVIGVVIAIVIAVIAMITSFGIYAFGEVVQLLEDIKNKKLLK